MYQWNSPHRFSAAMIPASCMHKGPSSTWITTHLSPGSTTSTAIAITTPKSTDETHTPKREDDRQDANDPILQTSSAYHSLDHNCPYTKVFPQKDHRSVGRPLEAQPRNSISAPPKEKRERTGHYKNTIYKRSKPIGFIHRWEERIS